MIYVLIYLSYQKCIACLQRNVCIQALNGVVTVRTAVHDGIYTSLSYS